MALHPRRDGATPDEEAKLHIDVQGELGEVGTRHEQTLVVCHSALGVRRRELA